MKINLFFSSDWHMDNGCNNTTNIYPYTLSTGSQINVSDRHLQKILAINELYEYIRKNTPNGQPKVLLHGGDLKETKTRLDAATSNVIHDLIKSNSDIIHVFITGNHDVSDEKIDTPSNYLRELEMYDNVILIDYKRTEEIKLDILPKEIKLYGMSYSNNYATSFEELSELISDDDAKLRILLSHFTVAEAKYNEKTNRRAESPIRAGDLLKSFSVVAMGHIHLPQIIKKEDGRLIIYVGSIAQENISEENELKRFLHFIIDEDTYEIDYKSIMFHAPKRYRTMKFNELKDELKEKSIDELKEKYFIRVKCKVSDDIEFLIQNGIEYSYETIAMDGKTITNVIDEEESEENIINKYLDLKGIEPDKKSIYINMFNEIEKTELVQK